MRAIQRCLRQVRLSPQSGARADIQSLRVRAINGRGGARILFQATGKVTILYEVVPEPKIGIDQA